MLALDVWLVPLAEEPVVVAADDAPAPEAVPEVVAKVDDVDDAMRPAVPLVKGEVTAAESAATARERVVVSRAVVKPESAAVAQASRVEARMLNETIPTVSIWCLQWKYLFEKETKWHAM